MFDREIITYVKPHLVEGFKKLQKDGLFPPNAVIEPAKDWLYLYPELDNGQWVNKQSQFIYAVCRFGNSEIITEEWSTDNQQIATVDETGIVTLSGATGEVIISCTLTDQNGETCSAQRKLKVSEDGVDIIDSAINEITPNNVVILAQKGVYNLHGIYLGDTTRNLPSGVYIVNGKKVAITK